MVTGNVCDLIMFKRKIKSIVSLFVIFVATVAYSQMPSGEDAIYAQIEQLNTCGWFSLQLSMYHPNTDQQGWNRKQNQDECEAKWKFVHGRFAKCWVLGIVMNSVVRRINFTRHITVPRKTTRRVIVGTWIFLAVYTIVIDIAIWVFSTCISTIRATWLTPLPEILNFNFIRDNLRIQFLYGCGRSDVPNICV